MAIFYNNWNERGPYDSYGKDFSTGEASGDAAEAMHEYRKGALDQWNWKDDGYPSEDRLNESVASTIGAHSRPED